MKKVLVLGGTGAMGTYAVPELSRLGFKVDVISLDDVISMDANVTYTKGNALDDEYIEKLLDNRYDAVLDFMIYNIPQFRKRFPMFAERCGHYIFLSSYRVYANEDKVITETSPRLLDVSKNEAYLSETELEYSLYKAVQEDIIIGSGYKNWTIVRPAITYSKLRYQLVTLEANTFVWCAFNGKKVILPHSAMNVQATMSWAGDVGRMLARLVLNEKAYGEIYTAATAEHHTWGEIAGYYKELIGLDYVTVDDETFLQLLVTMPSWQTLSRWQLIYDRLFDRVVDNRKILEATGMKHEELMPLKQGLKTELSALDPELIKPKTVTIERWEKYLTERNKQ